MSAEDYEELRIHNLASNLILLGFSYVKYKSLSKLSLAPKEITVLGTRSDTFSQSSQISKKYPQNWHGCGAAPSWKWEGRKKIKSPKPNVVIQLRNRQIQTEGPASIEWVNAPIFVLRSWHCKCCCKTFKREQMWRMATKMAKKKRLFTQETGRVWLVYSNKIRLREKSAFHK